jgi:GTP-binding protein HflX
LKELHCENKPVIVIFNKMDLYEQTRFDEFLPAEVKKGLLNELQETWMARTHQNCIFVSAVQNRNTADLRQLLFKKVKQLYLDRYPYKAGYWQGYDNYEGQDEVEEVDTTE